MFSFFLYVHTLTASKLLRRNAHRRSCGRGFQVYPSYQHLVGQWAQLTKLLKVEKEEE